MNLIEKIWRAIIIYVDINKMISSIKVNLKLENISFQVFTAMLLKKTLFVLWN